MNRKKVLLFILSIIFLLSLGYSYWRMPEEKTVSQLKYAPGSQQAAAKPAPGGPGAGTDDRKLHLELLEKSGAAPSTASRRNIFRPIFRDEMKALNLPPPPPPPQKGPAVPPPPPPAPPVPAEAPPPEPPAYVKDVGSFTFLGFLQKENRKTIFLSKNSDIFVVKTGDVITGKYKVTNITDAALTINVLSEGTEMIIPLEENKALAPQKK